MEFKMSKSPQQKGRICSNIFFCWVLPVLWKIRRNKTNLENVEKLYPLFRENCSSRLTEIISLAWKTEVEAKSRPKLSRALIYVFKTHFTRRIAFKVFTNCILRVALGPAIWIFLISLGSEYSLEVRYIAGASLGLLSIWYSVFQNTSSFLWNELGVKIRIGLTGMVYQKALNLSMYSANSNAEEVEKLISNDVKSFERFANAIPSLILAPFEVIAVVAVLWVYLGPAAFGIILLLVGLLGIQHWVHKCTTKYEHLITAKSNARVSLIKEVLQGFKFIKLNGWEIPYAESISRERRSEISVLRKQQRVIGVINSIQDVSSLVIFLGALTLYILIGNGITVTSIFVTFTMINHLRNVFTGSVVIGIHGVTEIANSLKRIQVFLTLDEYKPSNRIVGHNSRAEEKSMTQKFLKSEYESQQVVKSNYTFRKTFLSEYITPKLSLQRAAAGNEGSSKPRFWNFSLEAQPGDLIILTGQSGSGKSSLLQAVLGELPLITGRIEVFGNLAYVSKNPLLFSGSILQNILFNRHYDPVWYNKVIRACGLIVDISVLPFGDHTAIVNTGWTGNLGRNARINLARAVYADADIYLIDDSLASISPTLQDYIFQECILGLLKSKIVLFVTHRSQYFSKASELIVMQKGAIEAQGSFDQLRSVISNLKLNEIPIFHLTRLNIDSMANLNATSSESFNWRKETEIAKHYGTFDEKVTNYQEISTQITKTAGHWDYLTSGNNGFKIGFFLILAFTFQVVMSFSEFWLKVWTSHSAVVLLEGEQWSSTDFFIEAYALFVLLLFLLALIRNQFLASIGMNASLKLHNSMFKMICLAPMSFLENWLCNESFNRVLDDVKVIDEKLSGLYYSTIHNILQVLGCVTIIIVLLPIMAVPTAICLLTILPLHMFYHESFERILHMETIAQASVKAHLNSTLQGISTIRSFQVEQTFERQFFGMLDDHTSKSRLQDAAQRWYAVMLHFVSNLYLAVLLYFCMSTLVDLPTAGLAIYSAFNLNTIFADVIIEYIELRSQLTAVNRIIQYTQVNPKQPLHTPDQKRLQKWPSAGKIEINYFTCTKDHFSVPGGISLIINPKEKVGFWGPADDPTKTTLILALLRFVEPNSGCIKIDDIDISTVGIHDLRTKVAVIPQNPILFSGTVRQNLDPFNHFTDKEIWSTLDKVHLLDKVRDLSVAGLDTQVVTRSLDYCLGEIKLLYLARAILNNCKIVVLEEPWSGEDTRTDALIQQTIREKFRECTIITVTHHFQSIKECDRVFVLESGKAEDIGKPVNMIISDGRHLDSLQAMRDTDLITDRRNMP